MQVDRQRAPVDGEFHQRTGDVFDIDLKLAEMTSERKDTARQAKESIEIVELMDLRHDYSAAECGLGGIQFTVILIRMPAGHVFANDRSYAQDWADSIRSECLLQCTKARMETKLVTDHDDPVSLLDFLHQFGHTSEVVRKWFFDE